MDSNKDEAMKCMRIGQAAIEAGDKVRAIKFLTIAKRLYPNAQVDALLSCLYEGSGKQAADEKDPENKEAENTKCGGENGFASVGTNGPDGHRHSGSSSPAAGVSVEHIEIVKRIKRTKDLYQILGLNKGCSEDEVRKAYRKLSLKVHPDKNKAVGAEEAFKAVSKAFQVLSDVELREKYDQYGPEEEFDVQAQHMRRRRTSHGSPVFYEEVFDANDIFNSFFFGMQQPNGGFRRAQFVRTQARQGAAGGRGAEAHSSNLLGLLQLLPIILLFLFSYFPFSQPVYNLDLAAPYRFQQKTRDHGVTFYVKSPDFDRDYPHGSYSRRQVESQVEKDYRDILVHHCRLEVGLRRWGQATEMPYCDRLERFQQT